MNTFNETYTSFPLLPEDPTAPSFSHASIESLFIALTSVQEHLAEYKCKCKSQSATPKQHGVIRADLVAVCESLEKLLAGAEKTASFEAEFAQLERIVSAVWRDFDDAAQPGSGVGNSSGWMQAFRWSGAYMAWTTLFVVGFARSWRMGDRAVPEEANSWTDRRASTPSRGFCR